MSSLLSVYYSYGNTLIQQTLIIIAGVITVAILSFISVLVGQYLWLAGIFIFIVSLIGYFYIPINIGFTFFVKLGIIILAWTVVGLPKHDIWFAWNIFWLQLFGGSIAILSNTIVYYCGRKRNHKYYIIQWKKAFCEALEELDKTHPSSSLQDKLSYLKKINEFIKSYSFSDNISVSYERNKYMKLALFIDRMSSSLILLVDVLNKNPDIKKSLSNVFYDMFKGIKEILLKEDLKFMNYSYELYKKDVLTKRKKGFFAKMDNKLRKSYAEFVYIFETLTLDAASLIELKIQHTDHKVNYFKEIINLFRLGWNAITTQKIIIKGSGLTINSKLALRGSIAITASFIFACFYGNPAYTAWIIIICNVAVLVRQGDTIKKGIDRIVGHSIGFGLALILGWWVWPYFSTGYVWIPILSIITSYYFLANYFYFSISLCISIVFLVYYTRYGHNPTDFPVLLIALNRLIYVSIGTAFAILSSFFIFRNLGIGMFTKKDYESSLLMVKHMECLSSMDKDRIKHSYKNIKH